MVEIERRSVVVGLAVDAFAVLIDVAVVVTVVAPTGVADDVVVVVAAAVVDAVVVAVVGGLAAVQLATGRFEQGH